MVDDLLEDEGPRVVGETMIDVQVAQAAVYVLRRRITLMISPTLGATKAHLEILRGHVLGGIHSETGNSQFDEVIQELDQLAPHPLTALVKILEAYQFALLHLEAIVPIRDPAGGMEILGGEGNSRERLLARFRLCAGCAHSYSIEIAGHVVQEHIHVDTNTHFVASTDHVTELLLISRSSCQLVGDGLVSLPPGTTRRDDVLIHGAHLHSGEAPWSQEVLTLLGNVRPLPLEQVNDGVAIAPPMGIVLGQRKAARQAERQGQSELEHDRRL